MPAIMTHDFFGRDVASDHPAYAGDTTQERDAFLLGNQGPDSLFYLAVGARQARMYRLGSTMHSDKPTQLLYAMRKSLDMLDDSELPIGEAYARGFLCHYTLDCHEHPLIFALQYMICDAGIEGLTRENKSEVHGVIESELDEMMLYNKLGMTIADYAPHENILKADETVLNVIEKMYAYMALTVYGQMIEPDMFPLAVHRFRRTQHYLFHSPTGTKRAILASIEETVRPYSMLGSMAPRPIEQDSVWFENRDHVAWENPFTGEESSQSFWDLYNTSRTLAQKNIESFEHTGFNEDKARTITHDLNFSGEPVEATIKVHPN